MSPAHIAQTHEIELASGNYLALDFPRQGNITLDDIATGLANTCRFAGQCSRFYSVAEHACLVEWYLRENDADPATRLIGLHHDDSEAFVGDIPRPLKGLLGESYREIAADVAYAATSAIGVRSYEVAVHAGMGYDWIVAVKAADDWALSAEAYYLLPSRGEGWGPVDGLYVPTVRLPWKLGDLPSHARDRWIDRHLALTEGAGLYAAPPSEGDQ